MDHEENKKNRKGMWWKIPVAAIVFGVIAAVAFQLTNDGINAGYKTFGFLWNHGAVKESEEEKSPDEKKEVKSEISTGEPVVSAANGVDVAAIVEKCMPSVVSVTNMSIQELRDWFGNVEQYESKAMGSGIIVGQNDTELLIVTNNHVVKGAETLTITFCDDSSAEARVKGADSTKDIAVVAVNLDDLESETMDSISIAALGDSDSLRIGEDAIVIGNALGSGQSVTKGIISALGRDFKYDEYGIDTKVIQTDAAINPGNSGGALLNSEGEVVGISEAKQVATEVESICYAIPVSDVRDLIDDFMNREIRDKVDESERGILGIHCGEISSSTASLYNMPVGVYVSEAIDGMGADKAGMRQGDIIVKVDGQNVSTVSDISDVLSYFKVGDTVKITVQRLSRDGEYEEVELDVVLSEYKED